MGLFRRSRAESWQPKAKGHKPKSLKKTRSDVPVEKMSDSALRKLDGALQPKNDFMDRMTKLSGGRGYFPDENTHYIPPPPVKENDSFRREIEKCSGGRGRWVGNAYYIDPPPVPEGITDDLTPKQQAAMDEALRRYPPIIFDK